MHVHMLGLLNRGEYSSKCSNAISGIVVGNSATLDVLSKCFPINTVSEIVSKGQSMNGIVPEGEGEG